MESIINILIIFHAAFGGLALLTGLISIIAFKGKNLHKKSGKLFVYTMIISGTIAMVIALLPNHENPFLFAIGIFTSYLVITGFRALRFKNNTTDLKIDKFISWIMIFTGFMMIILPAIIGNEFNVILSVFGLLGIALSLQDLRLFNNIERLQKGWLKLHIGKILGGYISAVTAFVVVNHVFPGFYGWFIPSIIGTIYIAYWQRKVNSRSKVSH